MPPVKLWIYGDPMQDVWVPGCFNTDNRWVTTGNPIRRPGGALNTLENIIRMHNRDTTLLWNSINVGQVFDLVRLHDQNRNIVYEIPSAYAPNPKNTYNGKRCFKTTSSWNNPGINAGLVISEYNKGTANKIPPKATMPSFRFAVVDSRYRTLDPGWLKTSRTKIWHCTGGEYDEEWAKHFDYVVHSSAQYPVRVFSTTNETERKVLIVPPTKVVDPIGAGDTLVAGIACYLADQVGLAKELDFNQLVQAVEFGIAAAQTVITEQYTAISRLELKNWKK